jgi:RHS repeat-associated protein
VDGNVTSFAYDGFGRKRRESRGVNPDVILNWDGDQMIVESSDLDPEAPSKAYYVADGVIYAENANLGSEKSRRDYAVDYLGSVTGLTAGSDASLSSVRRWSAYGKLLSGSAEPIGYFWTGNTGSRVYQSLGLNDNRARHYGRNIKQWITRDPLWPSELPYAYVGGNPVTRIDPSGFRSENPAICLLPEVNFDKCSTHVVTLITGLCEKLLRITNEQQYAINKCITRTARASNQKCGYVSDATVTCFRRFCRAGSVTCGYFKGNAGQTYQSSSNCACPQTPHWWDIQYSGHIELDPNRLGYTFYDRVEGIGKWEIFEATFLHELGHACGIHHGKYGSPSQCQCNDIFGCCIREVLIGKIGDKCVKAMKTEMGLNGCNQDRKPFRK